eukprot:m.27935 g.27935  ORF g.27935 m.27935 type:complete len:159 (+) comp9409_c0_seq6:40-516(+)
MSGRRRQRRSRSAQCHIVFEGEKCNSVHDNKPLSRQFTRDVEEAGYEFLGSSPHLVCKVHRTLVNNAIASYSVGQSAIGDNYELDFPQPDFSVLNSASLNKYCKHFNLPEGASKQERLEIIQKHFSSEPVSEHTDILSFAAKIKVEREEANVKELTSK